MVLVESDIRFGAPTQLWTWDGAAWHQRCVSGGPASPVAAVGSEPGRGSPSSRRQWRRSFVYYYSMALVPDPISQQLLLVTVARDPLGPAHTETWSWDGRDWVGPQLNGQPSAEARIVPADGDTVEGAVFGFEDVSRDLDTLRINAWEWTGTAWSPIKDTTVPSTP
jgi:hypothetical protein